MQIEARLDLIEYLVASMSLLDDLRTVVKALHGLDDVVWFCYNMPRHKQSETPRSSESKIQHVLSMRQILKSVFNLKELLQVSQSPPLREFYEVCNNIKEHYKQEQIK